MTPILERLKSLDEARGDEIERWLAARRAEAAPYFYNSVDLRHAGGRLVPVDTNAYPAGFNNLSPVAKARAARFVARFLQESYPQARRVAIIPENHTRNLAYLDNLATLIAIFSQAGMDVSLGGLTAESPIELTSRSGEALRQYPLRREGDTLMLADGMTPDLVIINNDLTSGPPDILRALTQPVLPPICMGWFHRRKSVHFAAYAALVQEFAAAFDFDPWLLAAEFQACGAVDFKRGAGLDHVAGAVEQVLTRARAKHREYGIAEEPYAFIKADRGTYGMGIMTVRSPEEVFELNKKTRNKMQVIKEGAEVSEVIVQEGVPTVDVVNGNPAEPMIYMIDGIPVGGMYRVNGMRDAYGNLNAAGMEFTGMCDESEKLDGWQAVEDCHFRSFGLIAALAALATAREKWEKTGYNNGTYENSRRQLG